MIDFLFNLNKELATGKIDMYLKENNIYPRISKIFCKAAIILSILSIIFLFISHLESNILLKFIAFILILMTSLSFGINFWQSLAYS